MVKWFVASDMRVGNEFEITEHSDLKPMEFKEAFQEFYRLRAEKDGVKEYCTRCGDYEDHKFWCRVPDEETKVLA